MIPQSMGIMAHRGSRPVSQRKDRRIHLTKPKVNLTEIVMLARQLRTLSRAGVPILQGLHGLAETTSNPTLAETLTDVHRQLQGGRELHAALARHPKVFSPLFVSLVRVGENTGKLEEAFGHLADYLEIEKNTRERIAAGGAGCPPGRRRTTARPACLPQLS